MKTATKQTDTPNVLDKLDKLNQAHMKQEFMTTVVLEMTGGGMDTYNDDFWSGFYFVMQEISEAMEEVIEELAKK